VELFLIADATKGGTGTTIDEYRLVSTMREYLVD
jgi:hypothetical protein